MKRFATSFALIVLAFGYHLVSAQTGAKSRFQVPEGFEVEIAAPPEQTGSLIAMTFDSFGRPVISKEQGGPTILFDKDGDGKFETEKLFTDKIEYAQGMWFDGRTLYAIGREKETKKTGLFKMEDKDEDDAADTVETLIVFTGPMGEHGPHSVRRDPGGHPTSLLGNHTGIAEPERHPLSPLSNFEESQLLPRYMDARGHAVNIWAPGSTIYRLDFDTNKHYLLLGGFRNPYDHAFNREGEMFTFDSDMEWDIGLPWYREVRSVHAVPGGDYGWRTGSGKFPNYYIDSLPPMREVGRGSPVGVEFYHHHVYPKQYFDAYLEGDWSRGRILVSNPVRDGATYKVVEGQKDFVYGEPLNVTDLEVGPDGFVYFVNGGRATEGGLYRVAYRGSNSNNPKAKPTGIMAAVQQPQPLSSWGHAALLKLKDTMGDQWGPELRKLAVNTSAEPMDRVQALFLMQRLGPKPDAKLLEPLSKDSDAKVRAAAIFVVGQHRSPAAKAIAASGLKDADPFVRRRACEAAVRMGLRPQEPSFVAVRDLLNLLNDEDRYVRYAARVALERTPRAEWSQAALSEKNPRGAFEGLLALTRTATSPSDLDPLIKKELEWLERNDLSAEDTLRLLRTLHLTMIEYKNGASPERRKRIHDLVSPRFPAKDERLNREYALTLAYCGQSSSIGKILAAMPEGAENQPLQIHYVYALRAIEDGWTAKQKQELVSWFAKAQAWRGGASFPGFINNMFNSSLEFFTEDEKKMAYAKIPDFAPLDAATLAAGAGRRPQAQVFARRKGVQGVSEQEIFEYMMYDPMILKADPGKGKEIYVKAQCGACHRSGDIGQDYGPDLTTIGSRFKRKDIIEATLWPHRTISDLYAAVEITTKDGKKLMGTVVSEDDKEVRIQRMGMGRAVAVPKDSIASREISDKSTMPEGLLDGFPMNSIADLFAYLQSGTEKTADSN